MRIILTGSHGLVGKSLSKKLAADWHEIFELVRRTPRPDQNEIEWHPNKGVVNAASLENFDAVIHLGGESIAEGRWTDEKKRRIYDSRVKGTQLLSDALASLSQKPAAFLCASATGFYGNRGDQILEETASAGSGFLAKVCRDWEQATEAANQAGIRVVNLRFGPILAREGGMLDKMLTPFKLGVGGKVGSGEQFISWVAIDDVVAAIRLALSDTTLRGPINIVSPNPVTNEEFTKTLGHVLNRPTALAVPAFAARLAFGEMADEMLLVSQRVEPKKLQEAGFAFQVAELEAAFRKYIA
jgi:uncharacterized protein